MPARGQTVLQRRGRTGERPTSLSPKRLLQKAHILGRRGEDRLRDGSELLTAEMVNGQTGPLDLRQQLRVAQGGFERPPQLREAVRGNARRRPNQPAHVLQLDV